MLHLMLFSIFIWLVSRFSCSYSVAAERLVLSLMCPDMDTYCVQTVRSSKRQRNWAPFRTAVGHWSTHGPFILNDSLSHDGFALLFHLHGSTVTDFLHKSSCSLKLLDIAGLTHTDCVHLHCRQRFTHPSGEGRFITHKSLPGFVVSASANVCLVFLRLPTPPSLLHLVTLSQRVPIRSFHRRFGARHTSHTRSES